MVKKASAEQCVKWHTEFFWEKKAAILYSMKNLQCTPNMFFRWNHLSKAVWHWNKVMLHLSMLCILASFHKKLGIWYKENLPYRFIPDEFIPLHSSILMRFIINSASLVDWTFGKAMLQSYSSLVSSSHFFRKEALALLRGNLSVALSDDREKWALNP